MNYRAKTILIILLLIPLLAGADAEDPLKPELAAYPQLAYGESTGFIFGAIGLYQYYPDNITDPFFRNKLQLQLKYTEKKQFEINFEPEFNLDQGKTRITGEAKFRNWPSEFYGIGKSSFTEPQKYTRKAIGFQLDVTREIMNRIYLGFIADLDKTDITNKQNGCLLITQEIPGSCKYTIFGIGSTLLRDKRNSRNYPTNGNYQQLKFVQYNKALGSDFQFSKIVLDLRSYFALDSLNTIALQNLLEFTSGTAPFLELAELGDQMRAFEAARYIDNHLFLARIEYRTFPIRIKLFDRLGFVLFSEVGNVANSISEFNLPELKFCYGAGFRFSIFTDDRTNLRFDLGFSKDEVGINIGFREAF